MRAKVQERIRHVGNPKRFAANIHEASVEITQLQNSDLLADRETFSPIMDGHPITFRTSDPVNSFLLHPDLLMLQCFLIHALWMAGRAGQNMRQTYDSDDNVPSVAASDAGPSQPDIQQTSGHVSLDPARLSRATPELSSNIKLPMENPPGKLASAKHRPPVLSEQILCYSRSEIRW